MNRTAVILIGALAFVILIFVCINNNASDIQADIQTRTSNVLSKNTPTNWTKVNAYGRDVVLTGVAPSEIMREKAVEIASDIRGVADVENQMTVAGLGLEHQSASTSQDKKDHESEVAKSTPESVKSEVIPAKQEQNDIAPAPAPSVDSKEEVIEKPAPTDDHVLQTASCEDQFNQLVTDKTITFSENSANIEAQAKVIIYSLSQFADKCPNSIVEVSGHTDSRGDDAYNYILSKQRAQSVVTLLIKNGLRADRLHMEGYGETRPIANNNTKQGQANNRRIELKYLREGK
ncbi:MAG: OmpA family protein [Methylococcales bacterium]|nr:OmpA family protein [Methylococcales bacterium]